MEKDAKFAMDRLFFTSVYKREIEWLLLASLRKAQLLLAEMFVAQNISIGNKERKVGRSSFWSLQKLDVKKVDMEKARAVFRLVRGCVSPNWNERDLYSNWCWFYSPEKYHLSELLGFCYATGFGVCESEGGGGMQEKAFSSLLRSLSKRIQPSFSRDLYMGPVGDMRDELKNYYDGNFKARELLLLQGSFTLPAQKAFSGNGHAAIFLQAKRIRFDKKFPSRLVIHFEHCKFGGRIEKKCR